MIEVIYKDEKQEGENISGEPSLPKNIRQIGQIQDGFRIYMEDYVYTFLGKAVEEQEKADENSCCLAVFTGGTRRAEGTSCLFIRGALILEEKELSPEHVEFSDRSWQTIQDEACRFFKGQEIAGWFFAGKSLSLKMTDVFQRIHLKYFGGEKVLMLMDTSEQEEAFFHYENSFLMRQNGYYLYYEKNPQMQAYMTEKFPALKEEQKEQIPDEAVREFRKIIQKKKEESDETETEGRTSVFSYAAAACLALAVAAVGLRFYQNYQKLGQANARVEAVSSSSVDADDGNEDAESGGAVLLTSAPEEEESVSKTAESAEEPTAEEETAEAVLTPAGENGSLSLTEEITPDPDGSEQKTDGTAAGGTQLSDEEQQIYREESDTRKAERRIQETKTEQDAAPGTTGNTASSETSDTGTSAEDASSGTAGSHTYVIRPGDTLYQISVREYGSMDEVEKICELNGFSEDEIIYPGQIIVLP